MPLIRTITVDDFFTKETAEQITAVTYDLPKIPCDYGQEIPNFNMVDPDSDEIFSKVLKIPVKIIKEKSGVFRIPELGIHFESFKSIKDWVFVVALQESTFNLFQHKTGASSALEGYKFNYRNLFEWDITVNYTLKPGQGIFFRPWLFHSFDQGLIQVFNLGEV